MVKLYIFPDFTIGINFFLRPKAFVLVTTFTGCRIERENLKLSVRQVPFRFPDLRCGMAVRVCRGLRGASGIAPFL